ncbi:UDP-glycosyltransferase 83A1-like [Arachis stenosperma]|uniref:UDP-glycosyltransferase 83A1-like n=1 Tax=Arachis stenosperma TaxID=217475 RepID=UPI0025AC8ED4|nr:UDP-glycosyltransferase 83A1-like [Arachis stenosperma]
MNLKHVLVIPFPAQGHVNPLMHLSHKLVQHGCKVTFVNTEFIHKRVLSAMNKNVNLEGSKVELASIPDGLGPEEDRNDLPALALAILRTMPCALENLIRDIDSIDGGSNRVTAIVSDLNMAWALEIAHKLGIKGALINPSSAAVFALQDNMQKLIDDGIMDANGLPIKKGKFQLSPEMPIMDTDNTPWCNNFGDLTSQKTIYYYISKMMQHSHLTDWWLSNTTSELEPAALSLCPKILPIGPLMESTEFRSLGQFWEEDLSCLNWLNEQPPCSVIYVAFGSFTVFDRRQFEELALGLELTNMPFLWVVREDSNSKTQIAYPSEFQGTKGKILKWAPQQLVLNHPAIACFVSHCGWNSTMDGVSSGTPFLCWPYYADQLYNKNYVCDVWKVGLGFDSDQNGIISRWEIKKKVDQLLGDQNIRIRSQKMKDMIINNIAEGGQSSENFNKFTKWLKE